MKGEKTWAGATSSTSVKEQSCAAFGPRRQPPWSQQGGKHSCLVHSQLLGIPDSGVHEPTVIFWGFSKARMDFAFRELLQMAFCWADRELSCLLSNPSQNTFRPGRTVVVVFCQCSPCRHQVSVSIYSSWQNFMLKKIPANCSEQCFNPAECIWSSSCTWAVVQQVASALVG